MRRGSGSGSGGRGAWALVLGLALLAALLGARRLAAPASARAPIASAADGVPAQAPPSPAELAPDLATATETATPEPARADAGPAAPLVRFGVRGRIEVVGDASGNLAVDLVPAGRAALATRTDLRGDFAFADVPAGDCVLRVWRAHDAFRSAAERGAPHEHAFRLATDTDLGTLRLLAGGQLVVVETAPVDRQTARVVVRMTRDGAPVHRARVVARERSGGMTLERHTDAQGGASFDWRASWGPLEVYALDDRGDVLALVDGAAACRFGAASELPLVVRTGRLLVRLPADTQLGADECLQIGIEGGALTADLAPARTVYRLGAQQDPDAGTPCDACFATLPCGSYDVVVRRLARRDGGGWQDQGEEHRRRVGVSEGAVVLCAW